MSSSFFKFFIYIFIFIILFISIFFVPVISTNSEFSDLSQSLSSLYSLSNGLAWPAPGYTRITSPFGYRKSPTSGASTYHSGIDIGAPAGSNIVAAFSGKVTLTEFKGAGRIYYYCCK